MHRCAGTNPLGHKRGLLLARSSLGYISISCYFFACQKIPIADATTFTFLAPVVAALLSPWLLKEKISPGNAIVTPLCIGGVLLITQPGFLFGEGGQRMPLLGLIIGLSQPFFSATAKARHHIA